MTRLPAPPATRRAIVAAVAAALVGLQAIEPLRLSEWARRHFVLSADSSQQSGAWIPWPFQVGLLDAMGNDDIHELNFMKSKRVGYTKCLTASIGYDASYRRRNQAVWQPTDDDRDSFVETEIAPMIDEVPAVTSAKRRTTGHKEKIALKKFRGCLLHMLGGKAQRAYRRITVAAAKADELDAFDRQIENSLDPVTGMKGRLEGAAFPKFIAGTTPRVKGHSHIEARVESASAVVRYNITCPHCDAEHPLIWGGRDLPFGLKWDGDDPATAQHVCPHCRESITQAHYLPDGITPLTGRWLCGKTGISYDDAAGLWRNQQGDEIRPPRHVAFVDLWSAYSPQREWTDMVREFLECEKQQQAGNDGPMQGFVNESLARTWEAKFEQSDADALRARPDAYRLGTAPAGVVRVVLYVDTQDDRWEFSVWGFGRGREMWLLDTGIIYANMADQREWDAKLDPLAARAYRHQHGATLHIDAMAIDSGGHFTNQAYVYARARPNRNIYVTKGDSIDGRPIKSKSSLVDVNDRGRKIRRGVRLWFVGTDTAKDLLHGMLKLEKPGPGYVHFAADTPSYWYDQLTAEQRIPMQTPTGTRHRWSCPTGKRNEALDCAVGALFLYEMLELASYSEAMWSRLEQALLPDLFSMPATDDGQPLTGELPIVLSGPALPEMPAAEPVPDHHHHHHRPVAVPSRRMAVPRAAHATTSSWEERL